MLASLYDIGARRGYEEGYKNGLKSEELEEYAEKSGIKVASDFLKTVFNNEDNK